MPEGQSGHGRDLVPFFTPTEDEIRSELASLDPLRKTKKKKNQGKGGAQGNNQESKGNDKGSKKASKGENNSSKAGLWAAGAFLKSPPPENLPMPSSNLLASALQCQQANPQQSTNSTNELKKMLNLDSDQPSPLGNIVDGATDNLMRLLKINGKD